MYPADLPAEWREKAEELRRFGAEEQALSIEWCADDLAHTCRVWQEEPLTLSEAAHESGYSPRHLSRLVNDGTIPNLGTPGAPRLTRSDLPKKPGHGIAPLRPDVASSIAQVARAIATQGDDHGST